MKEVLVQLTEGAASAPDVSSPSRTVFEVAKTLGASLEAVHPGTDDRTLSRWFHAEVDNGKAAEFVSTLRRIPEVTAAYVKPPAEAP